MIGNYKKIVNSKKSITNPTTHKPSHPNPHPADEHHIQPFPYSAHTLIELPAQVCKQHTLVFYHIFCYCLTIKKGFMLRVEYFRLSQISTQLKILKSSNRRGARVVAPLFNGVKMGRSCPATKRWDARAV